MQIFATDITESALEKARTGKYPETIADEVSPERLRRVLTRVNGGYQMARRSATCASSPART